MASRTWCRAGRWACRRRGSTNGGDVSLRRSRRAALAPLIGYLFRKHHGTYGSPRITADPRDAGWAVSKNTVAALMAEQHLFARRRKRHQGITRPGRGRWRAAVLVKRDFTAGKVNQNGSATALKSSQTRASCIYQLRGIPDSLRNRDSVDCDAGAFHRMASVLDVCSRRVVGFALSEHHNAELAYGALAMAAAVRGGQVAGVVFHIDQGSKYNAGALRAACQRLGMAQSMGGPG